MSEQPPPSKRIRLSKDDLRHIAKEDLIARWLEQDTYLNALEEILQRSDRLGMADELSQLRNSESQLKTQLQDVKKRENVLILKLAAKEQEVNEYRSHIQMLKTTSTPSVTQLKSLLLDPAVNLMFQRMKTEVKDAKKKEKEAQEDLAAWKFTPDSQTGKRLMARCRSLLQENESIGKMIASGRVAKIEGELALQRRLVDEMKTGQAELDVFIAELDEDVEGMQSTIYLLQHQLREARTHMAKLQTENQLLKSGEAMEPEPKSVNHSNDSKSKEESSITDQREGNDELRKESQDTDDGVKLTRSAATASGLGSPPEAEPRRRADERNDNDRIDVENEKAASEANKAPVVTAEENEFTLTVKDSERQEFEDGFGERDDEGMEEEEDGADNAKRTAGAKGGRANSSGRNKQQQHDGNHYNNNGAAAVKRPYSPGGGEEEKNSKGAKTNGSDVSTHRSSRSNNAASSPAKKPRGASGGSRSRGRRVSVDDGEDDHETAEDHAVAPPSKGRSPRAGSRVGGATRATRGSAVTNGDAVENGMDCD